MDYKIEQLNKDMLFSYKQLIDKCFGSSNSLEQYEKYEQNDNYVIIVAKKADEIIGSITLYKIDLFTFEFQPCLMLFNVAVKEEYRKQKVAKSLMDHVIKYAKENGYKSISLTCLDDAFNAHKFYESVGFKKIGSIKYNLNV